MGATSSGCPRCGGMTILNRYLGAWYLDCVQCGYVRFLEEGRRTKHNRNDNRNEAETASRMP